MVDRLDLDALAGGKRNGGKDGGSDTAHGDTRSPGASGPGVDLWIVGAAVVDRRDFHPGARGKRGGDDEDESTHGDLAANDATTWPLTMRGVVRLWRRCN